nr:response regulator [Nakamurella flavida]
MIAAAASVTEEERTGRTDGTPGTAPAHPFHPDLLVPPLPELFLPRQQPPRRTTVLVVDDEDDQRELLGAWFRRSGCEVHGAAGAVDALRLVADVAFDLFVIDLRMPGVDGWALARTLRHIQGSGRIAICSVLDPHDYPPADDTLPKPVTRADVTALLDRHTAAQGAR